MTFFRTRDNKSNPRPTSEARRQRRQQLQAQQQILEAQKAAVASDLEAAD